MSAAKKRLALIALVVILLLAGYALYRAFSPAPFRAVTSGLALDLTRPDALIRTYSLSRLPPDLLKVPLARDVLTEDFIDYYENNENRLALAGTVRRIAFEHKLDLPERLLETVFNEPAEVALWRDDGGRLKYFAITMTRNALARAIQIVLPALPDVQVQRIGHLPGSDIDVLMLEYGYRHHLVLAAKGDRVVAFSEPAMLFRTDEAGEEEDGEGGSLIFSDPAVELISRLLDGDARISPFAEHFQIKRPLADNTHELILGARAFAFGYDTFAPGLAALQLSFNNSGQWTSAALVDETRSWRAAGLWSTLPHGPSLCFALPVEWSKFAALLPALGIQAEAATAFVDRLEGSAAVCWYQTARLYTPLFAAQLKSNPDEAQAKAFFELAKISTRGEDGAISFDAQNSIGLWQGRVASRYGETGEGSRNLKPALGIVRNVVLFSPDAALIQKALDVGAKRYPALADTFAESDAEVLALIDPEALSGLLTKEIFAALPRNEEALFRNAADAYLAPRLAALARYPAQRIRISSSVNGAWHALEWEEAKK
jgi:uncharacterized protein YfaA (DUF2138 family)